MSVPPSIKNTDSQSIDTLYGADGVGRLKRAVGDFDTGSLTPHEAWEGVASHQDGDTFVTADGVVVIGGVDGTTVRKLAVDASGNLIVALTLPATGVLTGSGHKDIVVTGTAVALRTTTTCTSVIVKADSGNGQTIFVGISTVTNNETAGTGGLQLEPGESIALDIADLADVFINGTSGDGVSYLWEA
jgi:hypothetical protein